MKYNVRCTVDNGHGSAYSCNLEYNEYYTLYNEYYTLYNEYYTVYNEYYTVYNEYYT